MPRWIVDNSHLLRTIKLERVVSGKVICHSGELKTNISCKWPVNTNFLAAFMATNHFWDPGIGETLTCQREPLMRIIVSQFPIFSMY